MQGEPFLFESHNKLSFICSFIVRGFPEAHSIAPASLIPLGTISTQVGCVVTTATDHCLCCYFCLCLKNWCFGKWRRELYRYSFAWTLIFLKRVTGLNLTLFILFVCSLALATNAARLLLRLTTASRVVYMPPASRPYVYRRPPIFELSSSPTMKVGTLHSATDFHGLVKIDAQDGQRALRHRQGEKCHPLFKSRQDRSLHLITTFDQL
jgi:hypothetical protein